MGEVLTHWNDAQGTLASRGIQIAGGCVRSMGNTYVGISGYNYAGWRGRFYPPELRSRDWLKYASRVFNSIELNGTFYSLKSPDVFRRWVKDTPLDFTFAVKGSRFITHNLKLRRSEGALANFYASGVLALGRMCRQVRRLPRHAVGSGAAGRRQPLTKARYFGTQLRHLLVQCANHSLEVLETLRVGHG